MTSTPQASWRYSMLASEEMVSTSSSAGWPAASIAARTSSMRLVQPVEVSLWTTQTARMRCARSAVRRSPIAATSAPRRQSVSMNSGARPRRRAISSHSVANQPVRHISTASPGLKRVAQRRLPRAGAGGGVDHHRPLGLEHAAQLGEQVAAKAAEIGAAMIHRRIVDRPQHPVGHVGGAGDLQKVAAGMGHGACFACISG